MTLLLFSGGELILQGLHMYSFELVIQKYTELQVFRLIPLIMDFIFINCPVCTMKSGNVNCRLDFKLEKPVVLC